MKWPKNILKFALGTALIGGFFALSTPAVELEIKGERIWLKADKEPIAEVMEAFSKAGLDVRFDDEIQGWVTANIRNRSLRKSLDELLEPFNYMLVWEMLDGPVGPIKRLSEIQVFRPGFKDLAKPIVRGGKNHLVKGSADGTFQYIDGEVLVGLRAGMTKEEFLEFLARYQGIPVESIKELGVYRIRIPAGANVEAVIAQLKQDPDVVVSEPNYVMKPVYPPYQGQAGANVPIPTVAIPAGASPVSILDSGIKAVPGYDGIVLGAFDAVEPGNPLTDANGHGTQMALIASGAVLPSGVFGENSANVPILAIRAFDENGNASNFGLMNSVVYAEKNGSEVLSMSWGSEVDSQFLKDTMAYAANQNLILVASAGNVPNGQPIYPAAYPTVLSVSAMEPNGRIWGQSNYGPSVDLAAPGNAALPVGSNGEPGWYAGTSIAAAYTAGVIAEYKQQHPTATNEQVLSALRNSLTDRGAEGFDPYYGNGALDQNALNRFLGR